MASFFFFFFGLSLLSACLPFFRYGPLQPGVDSRTRSPPRYFSFITEDLIEEESATQSLPPVRVFLEPVAYADVFFLKKRNGHTSGGSFGGVSLSFLLFRGSRSMS